MKKIALLIMLLTPMLCFAAVDHLAKTYQPLYCPQTGIKIAPVHFRTMNASPDAEISTVCSVNAIGKCNANLASLFGLTSTADDIKHGGPVSVKIDMSDLTYPEGYNVSHAQVLEATVQCLIKLLGEKGHTILHVQINYSKEKQLRPEWTQFQKSYKLINKKKY